MNQTAREQLTILIAWYQDIYKCSRQRAIVLIFENLLELYCELR